MAVAMLHPSEAEMAPFLMNAKFVNDTLRQANKPTEEARSEMTDPYSTWNPSEATDEPDGLPDTKIVPLIEHLRGCGVITLQSCYGHEGQSDGVLWVDAKSIDKHRVHAILDSAWDRRVFDRVSRTIWPEDRWEFIWTPDRAPSAIALLRSLTVPR